MIPLLITEAFRYEVPKFANYAIPYSIGLTALEVIPRKAFDKVDMSPEAAGKMFTFGFHSITYLKDFYNTKELILLSNEELEQFSLMSYIRMVMNLGGLLSSTVIVWIPLCMVKSSSDSVLTYVSLKILWNTLSAAFVWGQFRSISDIIRICRERKSRTRIL